MRKMYSDFLAVYKGKSIWVHCILLLNVNRAFLSKNGRKSSQILLKVTMGNKTFFPLLFFNTAFDKKKLSHH